MKKTKLLRLAALLLGALLLGLLLWATARLPASREVPSSDPAAHPALDVWRTNTFLERLSTNNTAFQAWGKDFMLRVANDHLSKVPLFGLKGPLRAEDVSVLSILTTTGAEIFLDTVDRKYGIYFSRGGVDKAVAWDAEMTGLFRDPSKFEHFRDNIGPWSAVQARRAAEALVQAKGLDIKRMGGKPTPVVQPETFNLTMPDGSVKPVTVFYTVHWLDARISDCDVVEIRFRRTAAGDWAVTSWDQDPVGTNENEPTDFASLYDRFFATK